MVENVIITIGEETLSAQTNEAGEVNVIADIEIIDNSIQINLSAIVGESSIAGIGNEMSAEGEEKIQYINQKIEGKIKSITRVKGEIRQC